MLEQHDAGFDVAVIPSVFAETYCLVLSEMWMAGLPVAVSDIGALGVAMSKDGEVIFCAVKRMWDYSMSKGDIVADAADVPDSVVSPYLTQFKANGYDLRAILRAMLVGPDFVRF